MVGPGQNRTVKQTCTEMSEGMFFFKIEIQLLIYDFGNHWSKSVEKGRWKKETFRSTRKESRAWVCVNIVQQAQKV